MPKAPAEDSAARRDQTRRSADDDILRVGTIRRDCWEAREAQQILLSVPSVWTALHRQKNRLFVRQTYGSSHTYLVSPTVSTVHTVRAHNVPVHAHCPSALAPRAPANGQLGAQPISMGESCAMQTVRYSRRGARQTDCRMAHRSSTPHTPTWSGHVHLRVDS